MLIMNEIWRVLLILSLCKQISSFVPLSTKKPMTLRFFEVDGHNRLLRSKLYAKRGMSFAEKKRRRAQKLSRSANKPPPFTRTSGDDLRPDAVIQNDTISLESEKPEQSIEHKQAEQLIQAQRESIAMLELVQTQVEKLQYSEVVEHLMDENKGFYVIDDFLNDGSKTAMNNIDVMRNEATSIHKDKSKLQLTPSADLGVACGEFSGALKGGAEYADSPRCTEFIVSLTKYMPPKINEYFSLPNEEFDFSLDASASMSSLKTFDRKSQRSALRLMFGLDSEEAVDESLDKSGKSRPFLLANEGNDEDARKITCVYFLVSSSWDSECGGGVAFENGETIVTAQKDRLVIFQSDKVMHKELPMFGSPENDYASLITTHLVKSAK